MKAGEVHRMSNRSLIAVACAAVLLSVWFVQASCKGRTQEGTAERPSVPDAEPGNTTTSHEKAGHNRLIHEKSPYLLQHAHNPVDWFPWGEEALCKARDEDKPIFLSIGYSTCHWCHVMEHESFENERIAEFLNQHFVPIKVDREERPDLDNLYMTAVQAITGRGGWPMSVFLTPQLEPFFGGTYFPNEARHGLPSFQELMTRVAEFYVEKKEEVKSGGQISRRNSVE